MVLASAIPLYFGLFFTTRLVFRTALALGDKLQSNIMSRDFTFNALAWAAFITLRST
jgi:hypothetical protein